MAKSYKKKERQSKQNNFNITARDVTRKCLLNRYFIHRKTIIKNREGKKKNREEIQTFSDKQKWRYFITNIFSQRNV